MATNTLITPNFVAKTILVELHNNLVMGKRVFREYRNEFVPKGGGSVTVRKPVKYTVTDGVSLTTQNTTEQSVVFSINKRKHVGIEFSSQELTHSVEDYTKRYIRPAAVALAHQIDLDLCALYTDVYFASGTAGTTPASFMAFGGPAAVLNKHAVPANPRTMVVNPDAHLEAANVLKDRYNPPMVEGAVRGMRMGEIAGCDTFMDQNVYTHTAGTADGDYLTNNAGAQSGNTLIIDNGSGTLVVGDIITIADVYSVNPRTYTNTGSLQQFTITANYAGGNGTISISPSITTSGAYQNVTAGAANDKAIVKLNSHAANLVFHEQAFGLVTVPLELPDGASWKKRVEMDGISVRLVKQYDITNDLDPLRVDIYYGVKTLYPELACRLVG